MRRRYFRVPTIEVDDAEGDRADVATVAEPEMEVEDRQSEGENLNQTKKSFKTFPTTRRKSRKRCSTNVDLFFYQDVQWSRTPISCKPEQQCNPYTVPK